MIKHKKFGSVRIPDGKENKSEHHPKRTGEKGSGSQCVTETSPQTSNDVEYDVHLSIDMISVQGGVCETQLMREGPNSLLDALVHQIYKYVPYSKNHCQKVLDLKNSENEEVQDRLYSSAINLKIKIILYQNDDDTQIFNPFEKQAASIVLKDGHFHSCIRYYPFTEEDQTESEDEFSEVKEYFEDEEWCEMAHEEKMRAKNIMDRFNVMKANNITIKKPYFMEKTKEAPQCSSNKPAFKPPFKFCEERETSGRVEQRKIPSKGQNPAKRPKISSSDLREVSQRQPLAQSTNQPRQQPEKIIRTLNQTIGYPAPLPVFGSNSLTELNKPKIDRNIRPIHNDCKSHIRSLTGGNEYLSRTEWDNYCRTVVEKYQTLGSENGTVAWASFKYSLQKSFSAERKNAKKRQLKQSRMEENCDDDVAERDEPAVRQADEAAEADAKLREENLKKNEIITLLQKSVQFRKTNNIRMSPSELLLVYKHLKIPELMIYDYILSADLSLDEVEATFNKSCLMIGAYYKIEVIDEMAKLNTLMKAHDFFLSKPVENKKVKPVLILIEESRKALKEMESSDVQAPFITIFIKKNFLTGLYELRSATLVMQNTMISSISTPTADKVPILLLAAYYTLNIEYPKPYQQFLRALEKIVTGKCVPSIYGQGQVKYTRFISLLKENV